MKRSGPPRRRKPLRKMSEKVRTRQINAVSPRTAAHERDGYRCQGPARGLPGECWPHNAVVVAHHINRDRNDNRVENLVSLCPRCHAYVHDHVEEAYELGLLVHSWDVA